MTASERNPEEFLPRFGLTRFRPAQREVIDSVLLGQDSLCIMPTGGGKSLCYQLPAVMLDGLTLVISPLIALMKDQVDVLTAKGIRAAFINSTLSAAEAHDRLDGLLQGKFDLFYVAPERFRSQRFVEIIKSIRLPLLAVDEAHCISEWGHDFRHDYARLGTYRQRIGSPPTIALTATATPDVQRDIVEQLQLDIEQPFIAGFARENLSYRVLQHASIHEKKESIQRLLRQNPGTGIVYVSTRKACEEIAEFIAETCRRSVAAYHAGLDMAQRKSVQEAFMGDELEIVVATNAFGMGIDKADVRFVIHYNMPGTLEAYYQEAGRAGRDGQPSNCVLLYTAADRRIQNYFIESAYPEREVVRQVYDYLLDRDEDPIEMTQADLRDRLGLEISNEGVGTCERLLEKAGGIKRLEPHRNMAVIQIDSKLMTLVDLLSPKARNPRKVMRVAESIVDDMRYEPVYVHLQRLADQSQLSLAATRKALGELNQLESFHYVPPFRGRAIHMTRTDVEFDSLDIDFETMEARKKLDYDKLDRMVHYTLTPKCRQWEILDYFGDPSAAPCLNCDSCLGDQAVEHEGVDLRNDVVIKTVARIALSGVARARERVGKLAVAEMLFGSRSAKMKKLRLDKVSTFGRLKELKKTEVSELLDSMLRAGWVEQYEIEPHRPLLRLTETGVQVMKDEARNSLPLLLPKRLAKKIRLEYDEEDLATSTAAVTTAVVESPASMVADGVQPAPPSTTSQAAPNQPQPTIPQRETAQPAVSTFETTVAPTIGSASSRAAVADTPIAETATRPNWFWTWQLLSIHDFTCDDILEIRQMDRATLLDHLVQAVEQGHEIPLERVFQGSELAALAVAFNSQGPNLQRIQSALDQPVSLPAILLFLKCR